MHVQFTSWQGFLTMGGYGFYVWLAYGFTAALLIGKVWWARRQCRRVLSQLKTQLSPGLEQDNRRRIR